MAVKLNPFFMSKTTKNGCQGGRNLFFGGVSLKLPLLMKLAVRKSPLRGECARLSRKYNKGSAQGS